MLPVVATPLLHLPRLRCHGYTNNVLVSPTPLLHLPRLHYYVACRDYTMLSPVCLKELVDIATRAGGAEVRFRVPNDLYIARSMRIHLHVCILYEWHEWQIVFRQVDKAKYTRGE